MRNLSQVFPTRFLCASAAAAFLAFGVLGCGGDSGQATGPSGDLPPEAKEANKNMEDFMKNQPKK